MVVNPEYSLCSLKPPGGEKDVTHISQAIEGLGIAIMV